MTFAISNSDQNSPSGGRAGALLVDSVALVTGGAKNLGHAISLELARQGAAVVVNDVDAAAVEATVATIESGGGRALAAVADMSRSDAVESAFERAEDAFGMVDTLINNAYIRGPEGAWGPFLTLTHDGWAGFLQPNLDMLFLGSHRLASRLAEAGRAGNIVNLSSHGAARAHRNQIAYDALKGAIESFTRAIAVDLAPWGIRVNAIRPGSIETEFDLAAEESLQRLKAEQIPAGRVGRPEDIGHNVVALCSDLMSYVTGQVYNVDGGMSAQARAPQVEIDTVWTPKNIGNHPRGHQ